MRILIACDKFKGSISAIEIAQIFTEELRPVPDVEVVECPLADGGDGTSEILTHANKGVFKTLEVHDPLFRSRTSSYGWDPKSRTAYIEMALASGIALLSEAELNPLKTSTIGTGELMADAITAGAEKIILGVGGSAPCVHPKEQLLEKPSAFPLQQCLPKLRPEGRSSIPCCVSVSQRFVQKSNRKWSNSLRTERLLAKPRTFSD